MGILKTNTTKQDPVEKCQETSTTPSCGGPLQAQMFRKVCFYEQKYDFWPIKTRFDPFKVLW